MPKRDLVVLLGLWLGVGTVVFGLGGCGGENPLGATAGLGMDDRLPSGAPGSIEDPPGSPDPDDPPYGGDPGSYVTGYSVIHLSSGATIEDIHAQYGTRTVSSIPSRREYLVAGPDGVPTWDLVTGLGYSVSCDDADYCQYLETPESEQASLAFYEGIFGHPDYVDQDALARIRAPEAQAIATGAGVLVAVIDTGADLDHPDLAGHLVGGIDLLDGDNDPSDLPNGLDDDQDGLIDEATGHGSHVAGIVALVAPAASIMPIRVLDSDGNGTAFEVAHGIYTAIDAGADIINLSLGLEARSKVMRRAIQEARQAGILVTVSAGNAGQRITSHFPANLSDATTIAATDAGDLKTYFSNYGSNVSVSAPGMGIMSTYWNGGYALWSGTSMAAPFVAGAAALRLSQGTLPPGDLEQRIEAAAHPFGSNPYLGEIGSGRLDLLPLVLGPALLPPVPTS